MRIRKHAKISPLLYTSSSLPHHTPLQTTVCQLNQSPWDVITFSPPHDSHFFSSTTPPPPLLHQGFSLNHFLQEEENTLLGNGSFGDSIEAQQSIESMKLSLDDDNSEKIIESAREEVMDKVEEDEEDEEEMFCSKIDSKGWQCHRIVKSGDTFCERHLLARMNKCNGSNNYASRESGKTIEHPRRGGRAKKSSDPNGFYYYSGFGPQWRKRRGASNTNSNSNGSVGDDGGGDEVPAGSSRVGNGELDYMEEVEEEEEEDGYGEDEGSGSGKKRARKPIKARSLKSLM